MSTAKSRKFWTECLPSSFYYNHQFLHPFPPSVLFPESLQAGTLQWKNQQGISIESALLVQPYSSILNWTHPLLCQGGYSLCYLPWTEVAGAKKMSHHLDGSMLFDVIWWALLKELMHGSIIKNKKDFHGHSYSVRLKNRKIRYWGTFRSNQSCSERDEVGGFSFRFLLSSQIPFVPLIHPCYVIHPNCIR